LYQKLIDIKTPVSGKTKKTKSNPIHPDPFENQTVQKEIIQILRKTKVRKIQYQSTSPI
jgi:hypothetical protein